MLTTRASGTPRRAALHLGAVALLVAVLAVPLAIPANAAPPPGFHLLNRNETVHEYGAAGAFGPNEVVIGPDSRAWATMGGSSQLMAVDSVGRRTVYPLPTIHSSPLGLTVGPDGRLWFTESSANRIGASTTNGAITEYPLVDPASHPQAITTGPDGALWFTEQDANRIGRITTTGAVTSFPIPTPNAKLSGITTGPDGALWFAESDANQIGRITTAGAVTEFAVPTAGAVPLDITAGSDGALWFTEFGADKLGRITTAGSISEFGLPPGSGPDGINAHGQRFLVALQGSDQVIEVDTAGQIQRTIELSNNAAVTSAVAAADATIWASEAGASRVAHIVPGTPPIEVLDLPAGETPSIIVAGPQQLMWFASKAKIGRVNADGSVSFFPVPGVNANVTGLANGPDGNLWYTDQDRDVVGSLTPAGAFTEMSTGADTGPVGITVGPDGHIWVALHDSDALAQIVGNVVTPFPVGVAASSPNGIVTGHDGRLWFTLTTANKVGAMTTAGAVQTFELPTTASEPGQIIAGPQDRQWYSEFQAEALGWSTNAGVVDAQAVSQLITDLVEGADHDVWTSYFLSSKVGWRSTNGDLTDLHSVEGNSAGIAKGHDEAIWFTNFLGQRTAQILRLPLDSRVAVSASVTPSAAPGATVSGSLTVDNTGRNDIGEPVLTVTPTGNETLLTLTPPPGWSCSPATGIAGGSLSCGALQAPVAAGPQTFSFTASISASAIGGDTATVTGTMGAVTPLTPTSPSASASTTITGSTNPTTSPTSPPNSVTPVTSSTTGAIPVFTG